MQKILLFCFLSLGAVEAKSYTLFNLCEGLLENTIHSSENFEFNPEEEALLIDLIEDLKYKASKSFNPFKKYFLASDAKTFEGYLRLSEKENEVENRLLIIKGEEEIQQFFTALENKASLLGTKSAAAYAFMAWSLILMGVNLGLSSHELVFYPQSNLLAASIVFVINFAVLQSLTTLTLGGSFIASVTGSSRHIKKLSHFIKRKNAKFKKKQSTTTVPNNGDFNPYAPSISSLDPIDSILFNFSERIDDNQRKKYRRYQNLKDIAPVFIFPFFFIKSKGFSPKKVTWRLYLSHNPENEIPFRLIIISQKNRQPD